MKPTVLSTWRNSMPPKKSDCLPCLIRNQKWKKAVKALDKQQDMDTLATCTCCNVCKEHELYPSLLHFACKFRPSLEVIKSITSLHHDSSFKVDSLDGYPLHIACKYCASPAVIQYLIKQHPQATHQRDSDGNTPLHSLVWFYPLTREREMLSPFTDDEMVDLIENVKILGLTAPLSVAMRNN